jgi:L-fuconolactonase
LTGNELIVDSHHHFWDLSRFDYCWMPPGPNVLRRNYLPDDMKPLLERTGVSRTVLVQAHLSVDEARFLLDIAGGSDFVAGVVAWVDLTSRNVGRVLDELVQYHPLSTRVERGTGACPERSRRSEVPSPLVGIRHQVEDDPDEAWLSRPAAIRGLKEVAARGLTYDLLVRPQHLKYIPPLAEKVPGLRMVVDHIAKPPIARGEIEPWATDMAAVAAIPGIYCKVSGMVTEADHTRWKVEDLKPYVARVVELFGFDRLMWGSDWPVCLLAASYERALSSALEALGPISQEDRAKLLGRNAMEFYRLT